jgi:hypothetical protein
MIFLKVNGKRVVLEQITIPDRCKKKGIGTERAMMKPPSPDLLID